MTQSIIESVLRGVLGRGGKRSARALRHLTGNRTFGSAGTLLTAAGVAWGIYETLQQQPPAEAPPPLPPQGGGRAEDLEALRIVRLAISAATADGVLNEQERQAILRHATAPGAAEMVERELEQRRPLADIVAGVTDPAEKATLYVLAYTILRADERVSGAERIYLAQLANLLGLAPEQVQKLETDTGARIDALGDQGQLGG